MTRPYAIALAVLATVAASPALAAPPFQFQVLASSGDPTPSGDGTLRTFSIPAVNNAAQVVFRSSLDNTSLGTRIDAAHFRAGPAQPLVEFGRKADPAPDGNGFVEFFTDDVIGGAGHVAAEGRFTNTTLGDDDNSGIFRTTAGPLTTIARENQPAPDADGAFDSFGDAYVDTLGRVTFWAGLRGTTTDSGVFRGTGGALTTLAREGQPAVGGNGTYGIVGFGASANNSGQAAFRAFVSGTSGGLSDNSGIFRVGTNPVAIAREGQASPDNNGLLGDLYGTNFHQSISDNGQVAFTAPLVFSSGDTADNEAIFRGAGGALTLMVRKGQPAPDANGVFASLSLPILDLAGRVAFSSTLSGTSGGNADASGVFISDGVSITQVARAGQPAPDGNGTFQFVDGFAYNDAGQLAFLAALTGTSGGNTDNQALYLYDPILGNRLVARTGESFLGSTITFIGFNSDDYGQLGSGLNDLGQIAFSYDLADGRSGVAVTLIPEPTAGALLVACGAVPLARRRRGRRSV